MDPVHASIIQTAARAVPFFGKKIYTAAQIRAMISAAEDVVVGENQDLLLRHLTDRQVERLKQFIESPQFSHLTLQATFWSISGNDASDIPDLRTQLTQSLRYEKIFGEESLTHTVDILLSLMHSSIFTVLGSMRTSPKNEHELAVAAQIATAASRNSELLSQITTINSFNRYAQKFRSQVAALHEKLRLPNVVESRSITRDKLYVAPSFRRNAQKKQSRLNFLLQQTLRFVVLGDPGAGKSTLAAKLAYDIATDKLVGLEGLVPILLVVRDHTQGLRSGHDTLLHYLEAASRRPYNVNPPEGALEYLLLNGRAIVIIDGVDELGASSFRAGFADLVNSFSQFYPLTRIVVTSRVIGYREAPLDEEKFPLVHIAPFTESQISAYVRRWFRLDKARSADERKHVVQSFLRESAQAHDLRKNPLILSLLCSLYSSEGYIPTNKPQIYERCAEVLFETWDRSRGIEVPILFRSHLRPAIQHLALKLLTDVKGRQALPRSELLDYLASEVLGDRYDHEAEAAQAAQEFLSFCSGRAWVLLDVGSDQLEPHYGFAHRTFLEFFAADHLVRLKPDPQVVWQKIEGKIGDGSWDIVCQLSVQILDKNYWGGADEIFELLLNAALEATPERRVTLLEFAVRCLESVAPSTPILRKLIYQIVERSCRIAWRDRQNIPAGAATTGHPRADSHALLIEDAPLVALLNVHSGDNNKRIINAIADSIFSFADQLPSESSVGMIYHFLSAVTFHWGSISRELSSELKGRPANSRLEAWSQILDAPTPEILQREGLSLTFIYETTSVHRWRLYPAVFSLIESAFSGTSRASDQTIAELGAWLPYLLDNSELENVRVETMAIYPVWREITLAKLKSLPRDARGSCMLLILPFLSRMRPSATAGVPESDMRQLVVGRHDESLRERSGKIVDGLDLPSAVADRVRKWLSSVSRR
ncbi:NACHT domain-containing protein [Nonomuraea sp. NPDC049695]|uniref:NACHT domain-containing protein n=1 Tax=Nonomuraea sp. NPDC049695 TaxID=3154734 RepID=UPI00343C44D2